LLAVEIVPLLVTAPPFVLEAAAAGAVAAPGFALMPFVVAPRACEFGPAAALLGMIVHAVMKSFVAIGQTNFIVFVVQTIVGAPCRRIGT
jgi:hypothetical protein